MENSSKKHFSMVLRLAKYALQDQFWQARGFQFCCPSVIYSEKMKSTSERKKMQPFAGRRTSEYPTSFDHFVPF